MLNRQPLFTLRRGGVPEIQVSGEVLVTDGREVLFHSTEWKAPHPARSTLKPFQFLACDIPESEWVGVGLNRYVACSGSLSATEAQVKQLQQWYADPKFESQLMFLQLPAGYPMDDRNRVLAKESGKAPEWFFHTCFSKHMAILEACQRQGWERETYNSTGHPYHAQLLQTLSEILDTDLGTVASVKDGCLLPSPVLPLFQMANLYQRLASAASGTALAAVRDLMMEYPEWVGGEKRADTRLMQANAGRIVAKEGADGLLLLGVTPSSEYPNGLGIGVKLASGYQPQYTPVALAPVLEAIGLTPAHKIARGHEVEFHFRPFEKPKRNAGWIDVSPPLSSRIAVWPEDEPYQRVISSEVEKGAVVGLSHLSTTCHVGTHTDAPIHFLAGGESIDAVAIDRYLGPCQVIEVRKKRGTTIEAADLKGMFLQAPRILFKTGTFPDVETFNEDFVALSSELVDYLGGEGVKLVGIDTPSIDPFDSKTLEAHHATARAGMGILEGLVLSEVKEGLYEMSALPLAIEGGDASPVRVALFPVV